MTKDFEMRILSWIIQASPMESQGPCKREARACVAGRERFEDATPLALKEEAGSQAKECGQPLKAGKGKETGSPRDLPEGAQPR